MGLGYGVRVWVRVWVRARARVGVRVRARVRAFAVCSLSRACLSASLHSPILRLYLLWLYLGLYVAPLLLGRSAPPPLQPLL